MSRLLSLLKSAAGEVQLSSALGRLLQALTEEAAASAEGVYTVTDRINTDQAFAAPGDVILNSISTDGGIDYDPATGLYSLKAGKLYSLAFYGLWENFGTVASDEVYYNWVDADLGGTVAGGGYSNAPASTNNRAVQPVSAGLYRPAQDTRVKVRVVVIAGTVDLKSGAYAIVRQIG